MDKYQTVLPKTSFNFIALPQQPALFCSNMALNEVCSGSKQSADQKYIYLDHNTWFLCEPVAKYKYNDLIYPYKIHITVLLCKPMGRNCHFCLCKLLIFPQLPFSPFFICCQEGFEDDLATEMISVAILSRSNNGLTGLVSK